MVSISVHPVNKLKYWKRVWERIPITGLGKHNRLTGLGILICSLTVAVIPVGFFFCLFVCLFCFVFCFCFVFGLGKHNRLTGLGILICSLTVVVIPVVFFFLGGGLFLFFVCGFCFCFGAGKAQSSDWDFNLLAYSRSYPSWFLFVCLFLLLLLLLFSVA